MCCIPTAPQTHTCSYTDWKIPQGMRVRNLMVMNHFVAVKIHAMNFILPNYFTGLWIKSQTVCRVPRCGRLPRAHKASRSERTRVRGTGEEAKRDRTQYLQGTACTSYPLMCLRFSIWMRLPLFSFICLDQALLHASCQDGNDGEQAGGSQGQNTPRGHRNSLQGKPRPC